MDSDAIVIGSGFGGAVTACRLAEAGYKVLLLERGRQWTYKENHPNSFPRAGDALERWLWDADRPAQCHGWFEVRAFPTMTVVQGAGVGGGSLVYANVSVEAPPHAFATGWPPQITYQALQPHYNRVRDFMNVQPLPLNQYNGRTRLMQDAAQALGAAHRFHTVELAIKFGNNPLDLNNPPQRPPAGTLFPLNSHGVEQGECYHCGQCDLGCPVNARNTLDTNYIPAAKATNRAEVRPLHLVGNIEPVEGGYRVHYEELKGGAWVAGKQTARIVIVAAGSLGSTELLLRCRDVTGTLPKLGPALGRNWSSNGDLLTPAYYPNRDIFPSGGPTISSVIDFQDGSVDGQRFWIQDGGFPDILAELLRNTAGLGGRHLGAWLLVEALRGMLAVSPARHIMPWFAQGVDAGNGVLSLRRPWWLLGRRQLHLNWDAGRSPVFDTIAAMHKRLSHLTGGRALAPLRLSLGRCLITPHPLGGCNMGVDRATGVVDHHGEVFGYRNLYVADGAIVPRAIGTNPSRTIAALAELIAAAIIADGR